MSTVRFVIFLTVVLSIWALEHLYVGWRLLSLPVFETALAKRGLIIALVVGFLTYPLGRILFGLGLTGLGRALEYVGAVWMGVVFLLFAMLLVAEILTLGGFAPKAWVTWVRSGATVLALLAAAVAWFGGLKPPRVVEVEAPIAGLAPEADGFTIAHISDVHLGTILGKRRLGMIIDRTETLEPDVIAITGDLVDGDAGVVEEFIPQMRTLTSPGGVFAVLGNHEFYAGADRCRRLISDAGYTVLDNAAVEVTPGVFIAGVPDHDGSQQTGKVGADLERALADVKPGAAVILLQHSPQREQHAADAGVDVMLNGHTHGGQIWPFHYLVRRAYPNMAGVYRVGEMTQVVSRGSGQWGPPMRLLAPAEIIRITLRPTDPVPAD
jgi:predicted MPP superfamily phosphohydrolase